MEDISQGPVTRIVLRLQSLGTDYGSDDLGVESLEEAPILESKEVIHPLSVQDFLFYSSQVTIHFEIIHYLFIYQNYIFTKYRL